MGRLIISKHNYFILLFASMLVVSDVFGSIGIDFVDDRPIQQFIYCDDAVDYLRSKGLPFKELKKMDPWQRWLDNDLWKSHYSKKIYFPIFFKFSIEGSGYNDYTIKAVNLFGGRGYIYDPRWFCYRLIINTENDRKIIASWVKEYFNGSLEIGGELMFFLALPYPQGIAHPPDPKVPDDRAMALRTIASYLGDFIYIENMREFIFDVALKHKDVTTRVQCIRSVLSVFESLPEEVQRDLKNRVAKREAMLLSSPDKGRPSTKEELKYLSYLRKKTLADDPSLIVPE